MVARICDGITTLSGYDGNDEFSEELWTCSARGTSLEGSQLSLEVQVPTAEICSVCIMMLFAPISQGSGLPERCIAITIGDAAAFPHLNLIPPLTMKTPCPCSLEQRRFAQTFFG